MTHRTAPRAARTVALGLSALALAAASFSACGDDGDDTLDEVAETVGEATDTAGARASAEALRALLVQEDHDDGEDRRSVEVLERNVDRLPGDPDVSGIEDADGDGLDDDGRVQVTVGDESACLTVAASGDVEVEDGECS